MKPMYNTELFSDIFPTSTAFVQEYQESPLYCGEPTRELTIIYSLICSRYGNSPIANRSIEQFKLKVFSLLYQHASNFIQKMDMQKRIRELTIEDMQQGAKAIYNQATNPGDAPTMQAMEEISYINNQNTTHYKKSEAEAIALKYELLDDSLTQKFLDYFKYLFKIVVAPEETYLYSEDCND